MIGATGNVARRPAPHRPTGGLAPESRQNSSPASEGLRLRLISELEQLEEPEALASWAHRALPLKNQLSTADAEAIEAAFNARLVLGPTSHLIRNKSFR